MAVEQAYRSRCSGEGRSLARMEAGSEMSSTGFDRAAAEARLDALEREAVERRNELRAIAESLPAVVSRRSVLASMVRDLRTAPDRGTVARRTVRKLLRAPRDLTRAVAARSGSR
jgi:hypothetical protein